MTHKVAENILTATQIIETGRIEFKPPYVYGVNAEQAREMLDSFNTDATAAVTLYSDEWVFNILGQTVLQK